MTETETRTPLTTVYACTVSGWSIPGKIWMLTNQIRVISSCARVPREFACACTSDTSGYIKRVKQHIEPFGLGLAKV